MTTTIRTPKAGSTISDRGTAKLFINRELSSLDFNARVLAEAADHNTPLLERLKFIAIFSSNLDEFFMVRAAGLLHLIQAGVSAPDPAGLSPVRQLEAVRKKLAGMLKHQRSILQDEILPELDLCGIKIEKYADLPDSAKKRMKQFFIREILPALTPLAADPAQPFPLLNSGTLELAVRVKFPRRENEITVFVEIPEVIGRFIRIPVNTLKEKDRFLTAEDLICENISSLFPGGDVTGKQLFRITRDMDYSIDTGDDAEDLLHVLQDKLRQRSRRAPVRIEYSRSVYDRKSLDFLLGSLQLDKNLIFPVDGFLHLKQFHSLIEMLDRPDLLHQLQTPQIMPFFSRYPTVFDAIKAEKNILLAHPYQSFSPIVRMLEEAAGDPDVLAIKQTLYRVSGNSPVIHALQKAAQNGKQVTVLVELKARFDESNNIAWAELLDHSGAHVVYSVPGVKVHSKVLMIVRKENGELRRYIHLGTGNYNDETAKLYTDLSLLSNDPALGRDAAALFNLLSGNIDPPDKWEKLSVSPFDLRRDLKKWIKTEISKGKNGRIIAKMNSLSDPELIRLLHRAAAAGVEIDLIIRGICALLPPANCRNIRIISIVDRYLEHSRIFYFGTDERLLCSSADWMTRNLDRRIETAFPIENPRLKQLLLDMLQLHINDRGKGRKLNCRGCYAPSPEQREGSQQQIRKLLTADPEKL